MTTRNGRSRARAAPIAAIEEREHIEEPIEYTLERHRERQKDLDRRMGDCLHLIELLRHITSETYWESLRVRIEIEKAERATGVRQ